MEEWNGKELGEHAWLISDEETSSSDDSYSPFSELLSNEAWVSQ